jgi:hypothetical protein
MRKAGKQEKRMKGNPSCFPAAFLIQTHPLLVPFDSNSPPRFSIIIEPIRSQQISLIQKSARQKKLRTKVATGGPRRRPRTIS